MWLLGSRSHRHPKGSHEMTTPDDGLAARLATRNHQGAYGARGGVMGEIPSFTCKPGCHDCCGIVPFRDAEKARIAAIRPLEQWERFDAGSWVLVSALQTMSCPFVEKGRCGIYDHRPMVCRLFGSVDHPMMACPHGCGPKRKITDAKSRKLIAEAGLLPRVTKEARHAVL